MKLTGILLVAAFLQVSAGSTAQRLSISVRNGSLEKVFSEIEKKTNYVFFYDAALLQKTKPVTVEIRDASVEEVLRLSLKGQGLNFSIQDRTIFLKREGDKPVTASPAVISVVGGDGPVAVVVQSETGVPVAGATVTIRQLKKQGMTDAKGAFLMKDVPDGEYTVEVTSVGYERYTKMLKVVNGEAMMSVLMKQATSGLDEMVVKGYYNTTKRLNTGNVTTIKGEDIEKQPVTDPILALAGRVAGVSIQQASGTPGANSVIRIRGQNSIANGNDPLYVIDGVPFQSMSLSSASFQAGALGYSSSAGGGMSPFNGLNPSDIERIEILKDADATAIYGSRGANGVVLITTKKGRIGKTALDLNMYTGGGKVTRMMDLLNTKQYLAMRREAFKNDSIPFPSLATDPYNTDFDINGAWDTSRYTNWQKVLIGNTASLTNLQGTLTGGDQHTQFILGGGYSRQSTAFPGDYADQKGMVHFNLSHNSNNQRLQLQLRASYVYDHSNLPTFDFTGNITIAPDAPALRDAFGNINWQTLNGSYTFFNPIAITNTKALAVTNNFISNLTLSYQILPGLQLKSSFGFNRNQMDQSNQFPSTSVGPPYNLDPANRSVSVASTSVKTWIIEPQVSFQKQYGPAGIEFLAGTTFQQNEQNSISQSAYGFSSDALISNILAASNEHIVGLTNVLYRYTAAYGRFGFKWNEKYVLNVTARRDGSSRFGPGKQFGNFASAGLGWIFSKEHFIENSLHFLSFGKLRASYGTTGNDQIADYQFLSTYSSNSLTYEGITGLYPTQLTNPYFAWEVVKKLEGGLELGFLKDRLFLTASYYRNRTGNQLVGYSLPAVTGFRSVQFNLPAVVQNSGFELTMNTVNIKSKNFMWTTNLNLTVPQNKLVSFPNLSNYSAYKYSYVVGKSLFIKELFHFTGVDPQGGVYSFATKDPSGNPSYPDDLVITKPVTQKYFGGIGNSFSYKGFQLDIFFQYVNQLGYNYRNYFSAPGQYNSNQPTEVLSRWQAPGDITRIQRFSTDYGNSTSNYYTVSTSDGIISDASFLRLKNLVFSYDLAKGLKDKLKLEHLRVYIQCQNLLTITNYLGLDPETGGINLPPIKMVTVGMQVDL